MKKGGTMKSQMQAFLKKLRLLPVLIVVASMAFVVRIGDAYVSMKTLSGAAMAEEVAKEESKDAAQESDKVREASADETQSEPSSEALHSKEKAKEETTSAAEANPESAGVQEGVQEKDKVADGGPNDVSLPSTESGTKDEEKDTASGGETKKKWDDASDTDIENSQIKKEMFDDLIKRRGDLDAKEKKLNEREALLEAAQKELDRKLKEMEGLRDELQQLLKQQTGEEAARIQSLVKIYSGMKPKDAARIFDTLDTDILMDVVGSMPESKAAPIIALMSPDRAKALTTLLAEQKKLPDLP